LARASKLPLQFLRFPEAALRREAELEEADAAVEVGVVVKAVVAGNRPHKHRSHRFS
jgi:hypothetical protein